MVKDFYKIKVVSACRADENGERWFDYIPQDTPYYTHEVIKHIKVVMPDNIGIYEVKTEGDGTLIVANKSRVWMAINNFDNIYKLIEL